MNEIAGLIYPWDGIVQLVVRVRVTDLQGRPGHFAA
jgi:hypothetical protein